MSDLVSAAQADSVRVRKERVHSTMLIELLSLLIFLAMAFAFVQKEESDRTNPWKEKFDQVSAQLAEARSEIREQQKLIRELRGYVARLEEANRLLLSRIEGTLPADADPSFVTVPSATVSKSAGEVENARAIIEQQQQEIAALRARLADRDGGGTDLPRCAVSAGFLLRIQVSGDDTYRTTGNWPAAAVSTVATVPGAASLGAGRVLSRSEFSRFAAQVKQWGLQQPTPCGFTVSVTETHGNLTLYKRQQRLIGSYFYPAYR